MWGSEGWCTFHVFCVDLLFFVVNASRVFKEEPLHTVCLLDVPFLAFEVGLCIRFCLCVSLISQVLRVFFQAQIMGDPSILCAHYHVYRDIFFNATGVERGGSERVAIDGGLLEGFSQQDTDRQGSAAACVSLRFCLMAFSFLP